MVRLWVATLLVAVVAVAWWSVRQFTAIVVLGLLLAYVLDPLIERTGRALRLRRGPATVIVYLAAAVGVFLLAGAGLYGLADNLAAGRALAMWDAAARSLAAAVPDRAHVLGHTVRIDPLVRSWWNQIGDGLRELGDNLFSPDSANWILGYATGFATGLVYTVLALLITIFISFYVAMDGHRHLEWLQSKMPADYRPVFRAMVTEIDAVWKRFFVGQLALALIVGAMTLIGLLALRVPYAVPLAILAGLLEVVPRLGPVLSVIPAIAVVVGVPASSPLGVSPAWHALLVAGLYVVIQQIENNVLVPRILGASVNLPPTVVLVGALAGAKVAGVPGMLLAAPLLGTARLIGSWTYAQLVRPTTGPRWAQAPPRATDHDNSRSSPVRCESAAHDTPSSSAPCAGGMGDHDPRTAGADRGRRQGPAL